MGAQQQGAGVTEGRRLFTARTLVFLTHENDVLLLRRAGHKRVFPNQYNGLGGFIEAGEDPLAGAQRELLEEAGIAARSLRLAAVHHVHTTEVVGILLFVFVGEAVERGFTSDGQEGALEWVPLDRLGDYDVVEDLPLILPRYLQMTHTAFAVVTYNAEDRIQLHYTEVQP